MQVFTEEISGRGLYDPGANTSIVNLAILNKLGKKYLPISKTYKTVNGVDKFVGITVLDIRIFNIKKNVILFVINSDFCSYDFIIGLDLIPAFKLSLDENLQINQSFSLPEKKVNEQIKEKKKDFGSQN